LTAIIQSIGAGISKRFAVQIIYANLVAVLFGKCGLHLVYSVI